jgi:hypothetical protein
LKNTLLTYYSISKGAHNVVADPLSCLEIKETPFEDTQETFLGLMERFAKKAHTDEFTP